MKKRSSRQAIACDIDEPVRLRVRERDGGCCVFCKIYKPYVFMDTAHYISRRKGGLGIEENLLCLCRGCHEKYDKGEKEEREGMREYFRDYLESIYPDWDEKKLIYRKWGNL